MSSRLNTHGLSVDELLERAASVANLAMLRTHTEPSRFQIDVINWAISLLDSELEFIPLDDFPTRAKVLAQLDINQSILAPVRRLPVELLTEIFRCVQKASPLRTLQVATVISHVCFTWRTVARGHGLLWTKVIVETMDDFHNYCDRFMPMARQVPLELRCNDPKILGELWDCIAPYASRWRRITLVAGLSMLPDLKVLYMENLERLVVDAYDAPISRELNALDFVVAPRLRHIALTLDALQSERQLHVPVVRTLTSLELVSETPFLATLTLSLLQACASTLQSLTIKIRQVTDGTDEAYTSSPSSTLYMKALTYLSLADPACALLNHITAPLVRQLVLSNVPVYGSRSLLGFLARDHAAQSLLVLRVYQAREPEMSAWIPCLQLMDSLLQLHFDELLSNGRFLEQLIRHADRPPLLPSLEGVALSHICRKHPELHDVISEMCGSRRKRIVFRGKMAWQHLIWIRD